MALTEGAQFAGYTIVRQLGSGGMGEVYLARHPRFPRLEALKVLRADLSSDPGFQLRFNREAELAAGLWHPHIVGVHDRGEADGQLWITMDYVEGTDLAALVGAHYPAGMPPQLVLAVIRAVADALDHAHHRGLLHRDVKPANIMISQPEDSTAPRILLTDFGIARPIDDTSGLTVTNMALGTVNYSAPEQLMGAPIDGRADQYSLAATAYYLLTGAKMYSNLPAVAVISAHLTAPPPLLGALRPDLAVTDAVFGRALAKDPHHRFARCADFAAALTHHLELAHRLPGAHPLPPTGPGSTGQPEWATPPDRRGPQAALPAPGEPTAARAPANPGWPPQPPPPAGGKAAKATRRRRERRIAAAAGAAIAAAALAFYVVVPHHSNNPPAPNATQPKAAALQAAQRYLEALARGDATAALALSASAPTTAQWVTADALHTQLAAAPITDITVTSAPSAPGDDPNTVQYVMLSANFGPTLSQARIPVRRNGNDWKLDTATVPVDIGTPGVTNAALKAVALLGVATDGTSPVPVFPGALAVSSSNRFVDITAPTPPVLLNALTGNTAHPNIQPVVTLNPTGVQAARTAVDNWEHYCYQGVAPPSECNALSTGDTTVSVIGPGDFSKAQFSLDPTTMVVAVSGTVVYNGHTPATPTYTVTYNAAGTVDLTHDPPTYSAPSAHR
ncbi:serine/threonine-protein kinase (plasmid) [Mycobacterium sp. Aquia_216]|nr:serine/threonine-protein kinase [Mycobacterium sp. Aquia_216]WAJ47988.1 serine/threonine-protein kinase [Mycobacterium sp. Aquia_216]